jgi:hypothetical protein
MTKGKYCLIALSFIICLVTLTSCLFNNPDSPRPNLEIPDFVNLVENIKASVVAISTESVSFDALNLAQRESGSGSGWILD